MFDEWSIRFNKVNFVFRCDGNSEIGMGHIMRCMSLGKIMKKFGCNIIWVMQNRSGDVAEVVSAAGFRVCSIDCSQDENHGNLTLQDAQTTLGVATDVGANVVLVDHYGATMEYLEVSA